MFLPSALLGQATGATTTSDQSVDATQLASALPTVLNSLYLLGPAEECARPEQISRIEKAFADEKTDAGKAELARVLVRCKDNKHEYYNLLERLAVQALDSDVPGPLQYDREGKQMTQHALGFLAFLLSQNSEPGPYFSSDKPTAIIQQDYLLRPRSIVLLGAAADPRAIPTLRRALLSHDVLMQSAGAAGLAELQDHASVSFIVAAADRAPSDAAKSLAQWLIYFDDPEARQAVVRYVPSFWADAFRAVHNKSDTALTIHTEPAPPE